MRMLLRCIVLAITASLIWAAGPAALAHEHRVVGADTFTVGWLNEPTYASSVNAVSVELARGGKPFPDAKLSVVVIFGSRGAATKTDPLTLSASDETPGLYSAPIVPTRPGTYTFHIAGTIGPDKVDEYFTSSETTFDNVKDPAADEFPAKDPSTGQLGQRADGLDKQVSSAMSRGTIGLVLGAAGVVLALGALVLRGRKSSA